MRRVPGRLLAALALAAFVISASWAQTGRVGWDGTWAGGWDTGNGVQLVFAGDTLYCSAKSGFIPGPNGGIFFASTLDQTRQTMRNLLDNLEEAEMNFDQVVSTTIYLDDLSERPAFEKIYRKFFTRSLPSQTTLQQLPPGPRTADPEGHYPDLEQMSLIAQRRK